MKYLNFIIYFVLFSITASASASVIKNGEWHSVKPKKGDGIETLLMRYELGSNTVLLNKFLALNELKISASLYRHKAYKLPVQLYNYNGKSIRSTIGDPDWEKAVRIQKYNEQLLHKGIRSSHFTKSKILWVPFHELSNASNIIKTRELTSSKKLDEPTSKKLEVRSIKDDLYGHKYATFKILDQSLKNKVFFIVSGHGGPDSGAICTECTSPLCEDEYAYDVSLRLARNLRQHGAIVEMVIQDANEGIRDGNIFKCDTNERLADGSKIPLGQLSRLKQRTNYINKKYQEYRKRGITDQVVLSIHIDSNSQSHKQDVFFCYYKGSNSSKALATKLRDKFQEKYNMHQKNRGYKGYLHQKNFYVLRKTSPPAVLIELANIRNQFNHKRILQKDNRQALANWLYEGLSDNNNSSARLLASSD